MTSKGKTIWYVCMPDVASLDYDPSETDIERFLADHPYVANTRPELEEDIDFAKHVLGTGDFLAELGSFARKVEESAAGLSFRVRFVSWERFYCAIERWHQAYIAIRGDILIYQIPSTCCAAFAAGGMLRDVTHIVRASDFNDRTLEWYRWQGRIYAIPTTIDLRLVYYNKRWMHPGDFGSRDAFQMACERVMKASDQLPEDQRLEAVLGIPGMKRSDSFATLILLMWNMGMTEIMSKQSLLLFQRRVGNGVDPEVSEAIRTLAELRKNRYISTPKDSTDSLISSRFIQSEGHEKYAMVIYGPWIVDRWDRHGLSREQLGVALPPSFGSESRFTFEGGSGLGYDFGVNADTTAIALCEEFLEARAGAEYQKESSALVSAHKGALATNDLFKYVVAESTWTPENSKIYPVLPQWAQYVEQWDVADRLDDFWTDLQSITPETDLEDILSVLEFDLLSMNRGLIQTQNFIREREAAVRERTEREMIRNSAQTISHRLYDSAQPIVYWLETMLAKENPPESIRKPCLDTIREVTQISRFIKEYIAFGYRDYFTCDEVLRWHEVSNELIKSISARLASPQLELSFDDSVSSDPMMRVHLGRLRGLVTELVINSQRFGSSGLRITVNSTLASQQEVNAAIKSGDHLRIDSEYIKFTYGDNGPGIAPDLKEQIFQPLYSTRPGGSGMGLATVRFDVNVHGGAIRECGELGSGARFELLLPVRKSDTSVTPLDVETGFSGVVWTEAIGAVNTGTTETVQAEPHGKYPNSTESTSFDHSILIVDDSPNWLAMLSDLFSSYEGSGPIFRFRVIQEKNISNTINRLRGSDVFDAVVLDVTDDKSGMAQGLEQLRLIHKLFGTIGPAVVVISGRVFDPPDVVAAMKLGASNYILKEVGSQDSIVEAVIEALQSRLA